MNVRVKNIFDVIRQKKVGHVLTDACESKDKCCWGARFLVD